MSNLLISDEPLLVLPKLAEKIGLNEAIILQQIHYWLKRSKHNYDGYYWIYNTHEGWKEQFPFWSVMTIRRTISSLEKQELIIVGSYNKLQIDNTKWYRIDYERLDFISDKCVNRPSVQNEQTICSKRTDHLFKMNMPLPEITSENTTENKRIKDIVIPYQEITAYLNSVLGSSYKYQGKEIQRLIKARWNEKNTLDDFKKVIDTKYAEWSGTDMAKYLRPSTLFGTKFESYLNQVPVRRNNATPYTDVNSNLNDCKLPF